MEDKNKAQFIAPKDLLEGFMKSKQDACFEKRDAYWIYHLCPGKRMTQNAPNAGPEQAYFLGEFKGEYEIDESKKRIRQVYSDGGACQPYKATRETRVEFVCGSEVNR